MEIVQSTRDYNLLMRECEQKELETLMHGQTVDPLLYSLLLIVYLYNRDFASARLVCLRNKVSDQDFSVLASVAKHLSKFEYSQAHTLLQSTEWTRAQLKELVQDLQERLRRDMMELLSRAYESISPQKASELLGISMDSVAGYVRERRWDIDAASGTRSFIVLI